MGGLHVLLFALLPELHHESQGGLKSYTEAKSERNQDKEICRTWGGACLVRAMENNDNEVACSLLPNMCKALIQARWS